MSADHRLMQAARTLIAGQFDVQPGEGVLITRDTHTSAALTEAIAAAVMDRKGRPLIAAIAQLPFQGGLADPYIPDTLARRRRRIGRLDRLLFSLLLPDRRCTMRP